MKQYSENELWAFINRADSPEKIRTAEDFIANQEYLDIDVFDDMMNALAFLSREYYHGINGM